MRCSAFSCSLLSGHRIRHEIGYATRQPPPSPRVVNRSHCGFVNKHLSVSQKKYLGRPRAIHTHTRTCTYVRTVCARMSECVLGIEFDIETGLGHPPTSRPCCFHVSRMTSRSPPPRRGVDAFTREPLPP